MIESLTVIFVPQPSARCAIMGKRSNSGSLPVAAKRKSGAIKDEPGVTVGSDVKAAFILYPFLAKPLDLFDNLWAQHQDVVEILESLFPSEADEMTWCQWLADNFEQEPDRRYLDSCDGHDQGVVYLRPFNLSWRRESGNKGYVMQESFRNLLQLILAKGFQTDADILGTERLVCQAHDPRLVDVSAKIYSHVVEDNAMPCFSISMIKGWSRSCAMHMVLKLCCDSGIIDQYKDFLADRVVGFQTIHCNFRPYSENDDVVDLSRGKY